jgi:hypothetical protein
MNMESDSRFGFKLEGQATNGWTGYAFVRVDIDETTALKQEYKYVGIKNDSLDIRLGRDYITGVCPFYPYWQASNITLVQFVAEYTNGYQEYLTLRLPMGVTAGLGLNKESGSAGSYNQTDVLVRYDGKVGPVSLGVMYASQSRSIDEKNAADAPKGGADDGYAASDLGVGVTYPLGDTMSLGFDFANFTSKAGNADDATNQTFLDLGVMMKIGGDSTLLAAFGTNSSKTGSADPTNGTLMVVDFAKKMTDGVKVYAGYTSTTSKNDSIGLDYAWTSVGGGLKYDW